MHRLHYRFIVTVAEQLVASSLCIFVYDFISVPVAKPFIAMSFGVSVSDIIAVGALAKEARDEMYGT